MVSFLKFITVTTISFVVLTTLILLFLVLYELTSHVEMTETFEEAIVKYKESKKIDMTVTLTTLPSRLEKGTIKATLISILLQEPAPSDIILNIPYILKRKDIKYSIPDWLLDTPIQIRRCEDWGPATKYIPTLKDYIERGELERAILVIDDDIILPPPDSIGKIFTYGQLYPNKALTGQACYIKKKGTKEAYFNNSATIIENKRTIFGFLTSGTSQTISKDQEYRQADIVMGYQTYLIRPRMFDLKQLLDYENMPEEAFFVDDVVISGNLAREKIDRIVLKDWPKIRMGSRMSFHYIRAMIFPKPRKDDALSTTANRNEHNNRVMVRYFTDYW